LQTATELLGELLPQLAPSVLSHVHLVAAFNPVGYWSSTASSSEFRLSGTVFLNQTVLVDPWIAADHLFHEALHQQLYDFRQAHSLLAPDFDREGAPTVCSLWNMPDSSRGNFWDVHRSLAAFHVYTHLALLAGLAEQRTQELEARYGPNTLTPRRTALSRAHYLHEQLTTAFMPELGPAGMKFVEWFGSVLRCIDPEPPSPGSYVHLFLDRYWREAQNVAYLSKRADPPDVDQTLLTLANEEVQSVRRLLSAVKQDDELVRFNTLAASIYDENSRMFATDRAPLIQFARLRQLNAQTILDVSPDGYTLSEDKLADGIVRDMVEASSQALIPVIRR